MPYIIESSLSINIFFDTVSSFAGRTWLTDKIQSHENFYWMQYLKYAKVQSTMVDHVITNCHTVFTFLITLSYH